MKTFITVISASLCSLQDKVHKKNWKELYIIVFFLFPFNFIIGKLLGNYTVTGTLYHYALNEIFKKKERHFIKHPLGLLDL